ncbi:MAG: nucleotidyltransferase domain-containing protein [Bacteroidota bacterium]|nr:nucleotidyltransferase domain-containing protein [Bacteroidota bacterium]
MQTPLDILSLPLNRTPFKTDFESIAKKIIIRELQNFNCKIFLFGSRATKENHRFSDMDIGIIPGRDFDRRVLYNLKDKLADSVVPFKVDIVNFNQVSDDFKKEAFNYIIWWKE